MDHHTRRISDELRRKHIRTLELLRELITENNAMRQKLNLGPSERWSDFSEGRESLKEQIDFLRKDVQSMAEKYATKETEAEHLREELRQAQSATKKSRAAEEAHELTLRALQARNQKTDEDNTSSEWRYREHSERLEADISQLREKLSARVAEADATQASSKLEISRLKSEVEGQRCHTCQDALVRNRWIETFGGEEGSATSLQVSQSGCKESESLRQSLQRATRSASSSHRRCSNLRQKTNNEIRRRKIAERELRAIETVHSKASSPPLGHGQIVEYKCAKEPATAQGQSHQSPKKMVKYLPGPSGRRSTGNEERLRESNTRLQRELEQHAKQLKKADEFVAQLEAELLRVAGDEPATSKSFVVMKSENLALRKQLAEIKQAHATLPASWPARKNPLRVQSAGGFGIRGGLVSGSFIVGSGKVSTRLPSTALPRPRKSLTGQQAPLRATFLYESAANEDVISGYNRP